MCRKSRARAPLGTLPACLLETAREQTAAAIACLNATGRHLSTNDVLVILMARLLLPLSRVALPEAVAFLQDNQATIAAMQADCWAAQDVKSAQQQPTLFD